MQYLGGKKRIARRILDAIYADSGEPARFVDAFCGSCAVVSKSDAGSRIANDAHEPLIAMFRAYQSGWRPPSTVTEYDYRRIRDADDPQDPMTAFAGFGCSWGGKYWGGYARNRDGYNYAAGAGRSLAKIMSTCAGVEFVCGDYRDIDPTGSVVYCDPPYRSTTGYSVPFDDAEFVETVIQWSRVAPVYVSEYQPRDGWELVASWQTRKRITRTEMATENLYRVR